MPRKGKNNKKRQEDIEIDQQAGSKWGKILQGSDSSDNEGGNAEQLYSKDKKAFNYDFTGEQILYHQKQAKPKQPQPEQQLTPQQKLKLQKVAENRRLQKQAKTIRQNLKKVERNKISEANQEKQRVLKQEFQKQEKQLEKLKKKNSKPGDGKFIPILLGSFLLLMFVLQYQRQIYSKFQHFRLNSQEDLYAILETDSGVTDKQLKVKYKKLVMMYHPDKNPNCEYCQQKFDKIMKAWQVLGSEEKRKHYDQNSGYVSEIKSKSLTMKKSNYHTIIYPSEQLWMIEVYDSTNKFCHHFANIWEQAVMEYGNVARFARIDVWHQSDMLGYLPYRFQIFPGLYTLRRGTPQICHLDYDRPLPSISKCIQEATLVPQFQQVHNISEIIIEEGSLGLVLGPNVKLSPRFNLIIDKFPNRFQIFKTQSTNKNTITLIGKNKQNKSAQTLKTFTFKMKNKIEYQNFQLFLRSSIIQEKSFCQIIDECEEKQCLIIFNDTVTQQQIISTKQPYSMVTITPSEGEQMRKKVEEVKKRMSTLQNFQIGLYQAGQIDLGYWGEVQNLQPENGQLIAFSCEWKSWTDIVISVIKTAKETLVGP